MKNIRPYLFLILTTLLMIWNLFSTFKENVKMSRLRERFPYRFSGDRFEGLKKTIAKAPFVGYYTNKSLDDTQAAMQFAQAQEVLAPSLLDFGNLSHEFVIIDCGNPKRSVEKAIEIKALPVKVSPWGMILAQHPESSQLISAAKALLHQPLKIRPRP